MLFLDHIQPIDQHFLVEFDVFWEGRSSSTRDFDFRRNYGLDPVGEGERSFLSRRMGRFSASPEHSMQLFSPPFFLQVESFFQIVYYCFVCCFGMTIAFRVSRACSFELIFHLSQNSVKVIDINCGPLLVIISYGRPCRQTMFLQMKFFTIVFCNLVVCFSFDPFGEIVG